MARNGSGSPPRNVKLDSFLRRHTDRAVYERIRTYEPCVVVSETINKVYMHVVLSDERLFLTEYAPRTLTAALSFGRVRDIQLVNDLPDFLRGKHRELCQHVRITYVTEEPVRRRGLWLSRGQRSRLPSPSRRSSHCPTITRPLEEYSAQRNYSQMEARMSACAHSETLSPVRVPQPPSQLPPPTDPRAPPRRSELTQSEQVPRRVGSVLSRLLRRDRACGGEERAAELHLYSVSRASRLYLHLQSSWNRFIIRSTLLLDPLYRGRCRALSDSSAGKQLPVLSQERTAHLFTQLSSELLQEGVSVEKLYLLLQELRTAAHRSVALCRLFWKSRDVCVFLVQSLEESLHGCQSIHGVYTADQLLLSTVIVQTLAIVFRETEGEPARLDLLSAENGALASRLLLALMCDPDTPTQGCDCELQALLQEYLDASCSLLFELLLLGAEASRFSSADNFLSVGWILRVLQPHPHLLPFLGYQVKQVVLVLSDLQESPLSPAQAVLLYQRCRLLLACLQYNTQLSQHLRSKFREEFRYFVKPSCAEEKLPPHYPISQLTVRLVEELLSLNRRSDACRNACDRVCLS